jgi:hypothetical protein
MIFKGTPGLTRSIPDYQQKFKSWNDLNGKGNICFMQNEGKWTTNDTMKQWFLQHIIPGIKKDKQKRREEGQRVSRCGILDHSSSERGQQSDSSVASSSHDWRLAAIRRQLQLAVQSQV